MVIHKQKSEKITVTIPFELKERLVALKEEMHLSVSAIYKEALEFYLKQKEIEKWERGAELAAEDEEYMAFVNEMGNDVGDIYDYQAK